MAPPPISASWPASAPQIVSGKLMYEQSCEEKSFRITNLKTKIKLNVKRAYLEFQKVTLMSAHYRLIEAGDTL
jgi:hypothetical protein